MLVSLEGVQPKHRDAVLRNRGRLLPVDHDALQACVAGLQRKTFGLRLQHQAGNLTV